MAYRFPLATVLRVREIVEKREERTLQRIQAEMARIMRQIEEIDMALGKERQAREEALLQSMPAGHLHTAMWEMQSARQKQQALRVHLQMLEKQRLEQMRVYQVAHRDREMLTDMYKEKRNEHQVEQARKQQKQLDDIFVARHHRG